MKKNNFLKFSLYFWMINLLIFYFLLPPGKALAGTCKCHPSEESSTMSDETSCKLHCSASAYAYISSSKTCECTSVAPSHHSTTSTQEDELSCANYCGADLTFTYTETALTNTSATGGAPAPINLTNPIAATNVPQLIGSIIKEVLGIVGALALLMFVYGGFLWLTSGGSPDRIKKGKDILVWAVIGLVVIFASYTLVDFVIKALGV
jgi:hypothetical protein